MSGLIATEVGRYLRLGNDWSKVWKKRVRASISPWVSGHGSYRGDAGTRLQSGLDSFSLFERVLVYLVGSTRFACLLGGAMRFVPQFCSGHLAEVMTGREGGRPGCGAPRVANEER